MNMVWFVTIFFKAIFWGYILLSELYAKTDIDPENIIQIRAFSNYSKEVIKTVHFRNLGSNAVPFVIYGNRQYGYFKTDLLGIGKSSYIKFIPPGYKFPVEFYHNNKLLKKILLKRVHDIPLERLFKFNVLKTPKTNYFLIDCVLPYAKTINARMYQFPCVINKYGELVWLHLPANGNYLYTGEAVTKLNGPNALSILTDYYYERINFKGETLESFYVDIEKKYPGSWHHDFFVQDKTLYTFWNHYYFSQVDFFEDFIVGRKKAVQIDSLVKIDLETKVMQVAWNPISFFRIVNNHQPLSVDAIPLGINVGECDPYKECWDWLHINSLDYDANQGYLISLSRPSVVVSLDQSLKKIKWLTRGQENGNSIFEGQHTAIFSGKNKFLLFDNSGDHSYPPKSRILEVEINPLSGKSKVIWSFTPTGNIYTPKKGSVAKLNEHIIAFFPRPKSTDLIYEINYKTNYVEGIIEIDNSKATESGYRVIPLNEIDAPAIMSTEINK